MQVLADLQLAAAERAHLQVGLTAEDHARRRTHHRLVADLGPVERPVRTELSDYAHAAAGQRAADGVPDRAAEHAGAEDPALDRAVLDVAPVDAVPVAGSRLEELGTEVAAAHEAGAERDPAADVVGELLAEPDRRGLLDGGLGQRGLGELGAELLAGPVLQELLLDLLGELFLHGARGLAGQPAADLLAGHAAQGLRGEPVGDRLGDAPGGDAGGHLAEPGLGDPLGAVQDEGLDHAGRDGVSQRDPGHQRDGEAGAGRQRAGRQVRRKLEEQVGQRFNREPDDDRRDPADRVLGELAEDRPEAGEQGWRGGERAAAGRDRGDDQHVDRDREHQQVDRDHVLHELDLEAEPLHGPAHLGGAVRRAAQPFEVGEPLVDEGGRRRVTGPVVQDRIGRRAHVLVGVAQLGGEPLPLIGEVVDVVRLGQRDLAQHDVREPVDPVRKPLLVLREVVQHRRDELMIVRRHGASVVSRCVSPCASPSAS